MKGKKKGSKKKKENKEEENGEKKQEVEEADEEWQPLVDDPKIASLIAEVRRPGLQYRLISQS